MPYAFGIDFKYEFYSVVDHENQTIVDTAETTPKIYIFDGSPTREQAINGTGTSLIQGPITSWTDIGTTKGKEISVEAIEDPDPDGSVDEYTYYIAINYTLKDGGQVQTIIQALPMQRAAMHHNRIAVSVDDIKGISNRVEPNFTDAEITSAIDAAQNLNQKELDNLGFEWASIWRLDKLNEAIKYKTIYILFRGNQAESEDVWKDMADNYKLIYENIFSGLRVEYKKSQHDDGRDRKEVEAAKTIRLQR